VEVIIFVWSLCCLSVAYVEQKSSVLQRTCHIAK
jgi:hypothetical protein